MRDEANFLILEGFLELSETEGGFGPIQVEIGGEPLDVLIAKAAGVYLEPQTRGGSIYGESVGVGEWRITLERIT